METLNRPNKIEAIFPLSFMQQGLLFHHLSSKYDQGFLNIEYSLNGPLDLPTFEKAWNAAVKRHAVLRSTVHWENLDKPVQITHREKTMEFSFLDWSELSSQERAEKWGLLKIEHREKGTDFGQGALLQIVLVTLGKNNFRMLWPNHHLLVDGWSSQIILNDVFTFYDAFSSEQEPVLENLPSHKSYLNWVKKTDGTLAADFWRGHFKDFEQASLFDPTNGKYNSSVPVVRKLRLNQGETEALNSLARSYKVTVNTIVQGAWSLLLSRFFGTRDICYGTTVSGRSGDFPNIHLLTGMFMNVQPVRNRIPEFAFSDWFVTLQKRQQEARKYEHIGLDEITSFLDQSPAKPLFDSLLIFENYPVKSQTGQITVSDFRSGLTSTYPVTMVIVPGKEMEFTLSFVPEIVDKESASWLLEKWKLILDGLGAKSIASISELESVIVPFSIRPNIQKKQPKAILDRKYIAPTNPVELQLVKIWENLFGNGTIGIQDDFFELGGRSLQAAKMFSVINGQMGVRLPPTILLEHPTIASLAKRVRKDEKEDLPTWKNLVPMRAKGTKRPLFCIHAGGGHVFFYNLLTNHLNADIPVYALRPSGIFGEEGMHDSIEEMAQDYVKEIRMVQPQGPYNLMVYCFSTAVGVEMANLLKKEGRETNLIVIDTMAEQEHLLTTSRITMRVLGFFKRLARNPVRVINVMVTDRFDRYLRPAWVRLFATEEKKNTVKMEVQLIKIYKNYKWYPYRDKVTLVLTPKADKRFNEEYIRSWKKIALEGVEVVGTKGDHRVLFEEPDVVHVANTLEKCHK